MTEALSVEFGEVTRVDQAAIDAAAKTLQSATFGNLTPVLAWLAAAQGSERVRPLIRPRLVAFTGHHALVSGVEPATDDAAADLLANLCAATDLGFVTVVTEPVAAAPSLVKSGHSNESSAEPASDEHVSGERRPPFHLPHRHPPVWEGDSLTPDECAAALQLGKDTADAEVDSGADLLIPALLGSGHEVALGVLICALTRLEPTEVVVFDDQSNAETWSATVGVVRDALFRCRQHGGDVRTLLRSVGGADIAALTGFIAQAAIRRTPVFLDGIGAHVAAVLAHRLAGGAESWFYAASESPRRSGRRLADLLGLRSVVDLGIDSDAANAAVLVLPMIMTAAESLSTP